MVDKQPRFRRWFGRSNTPVDSNTTVVTEQSERPRHSGKAILVVLGIIVLLAALIAGNSLYLDSRVADAVKSQTQDLRDELKKANETVADERAQKDQAQKDLEAAKKPQPAPTNSGTTTTVGTADGASLPANPQLETNREIARKLALQKGQVEGVDYTFNVVPAKAAVVNPGYGAYGAPVYSEAELIARLSDGSANSERAIADFQAASRLGVSRQNVLNVNNYVCVQQLKNSKSPNMWYIDVNNGNSAWGSTLVDREGAINCIYVGPEVVAAVTAGKPVTAIGFRGNCINPQEMPVTTQETPSLPPVNPPVGTTVAPPPPANPPTGTTISYPECKENCNPPVDECKHNCTPPPPPEKEKIKVCIKDSGNQNLVEIDKEDLDLNIHSENPADCVKKVEECKPGVPVGSPLCDKDPSEDPVETGNNPNDNGTPMPDPGPATDPAVPEEEAPDVYTPPAPPAPAVETPRTPEEIPVNEGAGPATPVEGTVDETVCEVCGGGMSDASVPAAAIAAPEAPSAPAVEDNQAAVQAEANRVAAEQQAAAEAQAAAQAEANRVAAEQAAAQQAAAEQAAAAQAAAEAQAVAAAQAQAQAEQQAAAQAQADAAAKAQAAAEAQAAAKAQAKAQAEAEKAQQQEEVPTQVAKNTHKGDSDKGAKTSNNVG